MKKLLAIAWSMPPVLTPRSIQIPLTHKYLAQRGWETTIIASDHRKPWRGIRYDYDLEKRTQGQGFETIPVASPDGWLPLRLLWRTFPALTPLPDVMQPWIKPALRKAHELLVAQKFSAIISYALPWSDHLVGLALKRKTSLPWIAHYSDPWVDSDHFKGNAQRRAAVTAMEHSVLEAADRVIFITQETADLVMGKYPTAWREKVRIIPHSYEIDAEKQALIDQPHPQNPRLRLVFAGAFYGVRSPMPLFEALKILRQTMPLDELLEVRLVGTVPPRYGYQQAAQDMDLGQIVQFPGIMTHGDSLRQMADADAALVIDPPTVSEILPSKMTDYMPLKKPILGITPPDGAAGKLIKRLGCPVAAPDDTQAIAEALRTLISQWQAGTLSVTPQYEMVAAEYHITHTIERFEAILNEITA